MKHETLIRGLLILPSASLEEGEGDALRLRAEFIGLLNLFWACLYGSRNGVHSNMTDGHVAEAKARGSREQGYVIQVSIKVNAVRLIGNADT